MKYAELKRKHDELEAEVIDALKEEILDSQIQSKFMNNPVIKVNVFDYVELTLIGDELVFLDNDGYHYSMYSECSLEDLVDILSKI